MRDAGQGDVAVMNNGGIRTGLAAGVATYGSLFELQPFGNTLYRITVTGAALRDYLERVVYRRGQPSVHVSGLTIVYDSTAGEGSRLRSVTMANGAALDTRGPVPHHPQRLHGAGRRGTRLLRTSAHP